MKRKVTWHEEEESDYEDTITNEDEKTNNEEPRSKGVFEGLSQLVSRQKDSDLLHSMAASKDISFWTPRGQILRKNRVIPVTNIAELVEYVLLPHNDEVVKPRALKTESARRWSNKWTKILYQDYLHCIANFCRALLIIFSKQFISSNTKRRKRMLNFV